MVSSTFKKVIFFILVGVFYMFFFLLTHKFTMDLSKTSSKFLLLMTCLTLSLSLFTSTEILGLFGKGECYSFDSAGKPVYDSRYVEKLSIAPPNTLEDSCRNCNNFSITPAKKCMGGWYLHQGNSPEAKMCQEMANTPEGLDEINRYSCGSGEFIGMPAHGFNYTPLSNSQWNNDRCKKPASDDPMNNSYLG